MHCIISYQTLFPRESLTHAYIKQVQKDDMIPELLVCPPGTDLHDHPFVQTGSILLQVPYPISVSVFIVLKFL